MLSRVLVTWCEMVFSVNRRGMVAVGVNFRGMNGFTTRMLPAGFSLKVMT